MFTFINIKVLKISSIFFMFFLCFGAIALSGVNNPPEEGSSVHFHIDPPEWGS